MWSAMPAVKSRPLNLVFEIPTSKTLEFWQWIEEGEIYTTKCKVCGALHFPPVGDCPECLSSEMEWVKMDGRGEVEAVLGGPRLARDDGEDGGRGEGPPGVGPRPDALVAALGSQAGKPESVLLCEIFKLDLGLVACGTFDSSLTE